MRVRVFHGGAARKAGFVAGSLACYSKPKPYIRSQFCCGQIRLTFFLGLDLRANDPVRLGFQGLELAVACFWSQMPRTAPYHLKP